MEACPEDHRLASFVDGRLSGDAARDVELHLDGCDECRRLVSTIVALRSGPREAGRGRGEAASSEAEPIGRFVLMGVLGRGAMGVVHRAYDPALEREVALKVLRDDGLDEREREQRSARLEREARALARVRHAHVIAVYDVGRVASRVFVAMELVEGETLASRLTRERPSTDAILALLEQAGRGLLAAHTAGVIHRDFKPENVLVGHDGRVVVTDFGLAIANERAEPDPARSSAAPEEPSAARLTRTGATLGTPAYMAPEQARGEPACARSDQYSFCVALWEALSGELPTRPDEAPGPAALAAQRARDERRIPLRVRRALRRGLSLSPDERFPTMAELLEALRPPRRRRAWLLAPALGLAAVAVAAVYLRARPDACAATGHGLDDVWNAEARARVDAAFAASGKPWAKETAVDVARLLDAYAAEWGRVQRDACEAAHVRRDQSSALFGERARCLEVRRREAQALIRLLADGTTGLERAASAARGLSGLAACSDVTALAGRVAPPRDAPTLAATDAIDGELGALRSEVALGRAQAAIPALQAVADRARALGHGPTQARALWLLGYAQATSAEPLSAEPTLREAARVADAAGDDDTRARAWMEVARLLDYRTERHAEAAEANETARAAIARLGGSDELEGKRLDSLAISRYQAGRVAEAMDAGRRALALRERALGPESPEVAESLNHLGSILAGAGKDLDREAIDRLRAALVLYDKLYGPAHPSSAAVRAGLTRALLLAGHFEEAVVEGPRSVQLLEAVKGPEHPTVGYALEFLALGLDALGRYQEALPMHARAHAIFDKTLGAKHRETAGVQLDWGTALVKLGRLDEADARIGRGRAVLEEILPADHPKRADGLRATAELRLAQGRAADALPLLERALELASAEGPAVRGQLHALLARAEAAMHRAADAQASLRSARAELELAGDAGKPVSRELDAWVGSAAGPSSR